MVSRSTRSQSPNLAPYDSELEKTTRKNARNKVSTSTTQVDGLISDSKSSAPTPPRQRATSMALTISEAGQPLKSSPSARANNAPSCIIYPEVEEGTQFELKPGILNLLPSFHKDDPHMHLKLYLEAVENIIITGMEPECVKLRLFTYTLKDRAKAWLYSLLANSITTWDQLQGKFLLKFFPMSKPLALKKEILAFSQKPGEAFHETWDRFGKLFMKCPHHGLDSALQMQIFCDGLNVITKSNVNASAGGSLMEKRARQAYELYDMLATNSQQWSEDNTYKRGVFEINRATPNVSAQIASLERKIEAMMRGSSVATTSRVCAICSEQTHDITQCPSKVAFPELVEEHFNALNTFNGPKNDPFSFTYNPGWRNHPNFGWGGQQQSRQPQPTTSQT